MYNLYENIYALCKERGITPGGLCRALAYISKHFLPCQHFFPTFFPFFYPLLTYTISSPPSLPPTTISGPPVSFFTKASDRHSRSGIPNVRMICPLGRTSRLHRSAAAPSEKPARAPTAATANAPAASPRSLSLVLGVVCFLT